MSAAQIAGLVTAATGLITAITALVKVLRHQRSHARQQGTGNAPHS